MNKFGNFFKYHEKKISIIILFFICLSSILLMVDGLENPGLYYDDSGHPAVAVQVINNDPISRYWTTINVEIFEQVFPLWGTYEGTMSTYTLLPFVYFLGPEVETIRIYGIVIVFLTTIFTYLFSKEAFNEKIGLLSAALLL